MQADPCHWCADTGRVHVGLGPPISCRVCSPTIADFAIEVAADALGLLVFAVVGAGWWGRATRAVEWVGRVEDAVVGKGKWRR